MRTKPRTPFSVQVDSELEQPGELDFLSLLTTTVALFGLGLISVSSLVSILAR